MVMGRRAAQEKARAETVSIGELRAMIEAARTRGGMGRVNPTLPMHQVCDIYERALDGRPDDEVPKAWRSDYYSRRDNAVKPSRDFLIVCNILRDCA